MDKNKITNTIKNLIIVGVTLAFAPLILEKISILYQKDFALAWAIIVLLACTFFWLIGWTIFVQEETDLLSDIFPTTNLGLAKYLSYTVPLVLGILFGFLISSVFDLRLYLIFAIIITAIAFISDIVAIFYFKDNMPQKKDEYLAELINNYYFRARYILRLILIPLLYLIILLIIYPHQDFKIQGYIATSGVLLISEIIIWNWRIKRNNKLIEKKKSN